VQKVQVVRKDGVAVLLRATEPVFSADGDLLAITQSLDTTAEAAVHEAQRAGARLARPAHDHRQGLAHRDGG
jgi:hypothetical protein